MSGDDSTSRTGSRTRVDLSAVLSRPDVARLPIIAHLPEIRDAVRESGVIVVQAPPGTGKSTIIPLALREDDGSGGIVMLQPRRVAARAIAARMAALVGEEVGRSVGYSVRFERRVSPETAIEVVTEGILVRRIQKDLELSGVGTVVIDEFHERSIHADLSLALLLDVRRSIRPELRIIIMSATLDRSELLRTLGPVPFIEVPGRNFPVRVEYLPAAPQGRITETTGRTIERALARDEGDLLAFLPGLGEIKAVKEQLDRALPHGVTVSMLYGEMPLQQQQQVLAPDDSGTRRVILATPVAETSLTVEGLRIVVDSGLRRAVQFDPAYGMDRVKTVQITRDSAEQRAGRAGRVGPGICYRLWTHASQSALRATRGAEILEVDLASLVLNLSVWGVSDPSSLSWMDPPPQASVEAARTLLQSLGALDAEFRATPRGHMLSALPLHPRIAAMLVDAASWGMTDLGCELAALLDERDPFAPGKRPGTDIELRLGLLREAPGVRAAGAERAAVERIRRLARELRTLVPRVTAQSARRSVSPGILLATAYPERIARRKGALAHAAREGVRYLLASGTSVILEPGDPLVTSEWLVVPHLGLFRGEATAFLACRLTAEEITEFFGDKLRVEQTTTFDSAKGQLLSEEVSLLGAIVVSRRRLEPSGVDHGNLLVDAIRSNGISALGWSDEATAWRARAGAVRLHVPDAEIPDLSDEALLRELERWLGPFLTGDTKALSSIDPLPPLKAYVGWEKARTIDTVAPASITLPGGRVRAISYSPAEGALLAATVQELFGWQSTPILGPGRIPLRLEILSPAKRPVQITKDLKSFWTTGYKEVRKELRGRYPKHPWPEDPTTSPPLPKKR